MSKKEKLSLVFMILFAVIFVVLAPNADRDSPIPLLMMFDFWGFVLASIFFVE